MHKSKTFAGIFSCFLLLSLIFIVNTGEQAEAARTDIWVDWEFLDPASSDGSENLPYKYIQDAIDAAKDGDIIRVVGNEPTKFRPRYYNEQLVIDKSITITTSDRPRDRATIIYNDNTGNSSLIKITAESVSFENFIIMDNRTVGRQAVFYVDSTANGAKIISNKINHSYMGYGIYVNGANNIIIRNNSINRTKGIYITDSDLLTIDKNIVSNCSEKPALQLKSSNKNHILENCFNHSFKGIMADSSSENIIYNNTMAVNELYGIHISGGSDNDLENNSIYYNGNAGINLDCSGGNIYGNDVWENNYGFVMYGSNYLIENNTFRDSTDKGVWTRAGGNLFIKNHLLNNSLNAKDDANNNWDNGVIGNNWGDFYGADPSNKNNTIAYDHENPHFVYRYLRNGVVDNYPTGAYHVEPDIKIDSTKRTSPSPYTLDEGVGTEPRLAVIVTDPDPGPYTQRMDVSFYYISEDVHYLIGTDQNVESGGNASVAWFPGYQYLGLRWGYVGVWYVEVTDRYWVNDNGRTYTLSTNTSPVWVFTTALSPVDNNKPSAVIKVQDEYYNVVNGEVRAQLNDTIKFYGSDCNDPDGDDILFYKWNFGEDETCVLNEVNTTYMYSKKPGEFTANLVIIDERGASNTTDIKVIIESDLNLPPVADAGGFYQGIVNEPVVFDASISKDPNTGDILSYYWDFGDDENAASTYASHTYSQAGNYTVTLTVTDQDGEMDTIITYALIKTKSSSGSPGFEIILVIFSLLVVYICLRKRKKLQ